MKNDLIMYAVPVYDKARLRLVSVAVEATTPLNAVILALRQVFVAERETQSPDLESITYLLNKDIDGILPELDEDKSERCLELMISMVREKGHYLVDRPTNITKLMKES